MTFPSLTEQARIATHGMFDEEILNDLETLDVVPCMIPGCGKTIYWRITMRCCHTSATFCDHHGKRTIARMRHKLATADIPICLTCDHVFPSGSVLEDIARVVAL